MMMMINYKTNKCHTFATHIRFIEDDDDDNDDGGEDVYHEQVSQYCDTYSLL